VAEHRGLQLDDDSDFQRREWRMQRIGWWCLGVFVVAALVGVFGSGPLSHTVAEASGLSVDYERFLRSGTASRLTIEMPPSGTGTSAELSLSRAYVDAIEIEQILPAPTASELRGDEALFVFERREAASMPFTVEIKFAPRRMGRPTATVRGGGASITFSQLTYP
jgi:hypothetical protein